MRFLLWVERRVRRLETCLRAYFAQYLRPEKHGDDPRHPERESGYAILARLKREKQEAAALTAMLKADTAALATI